MILNVRKNKCRHTEHRRTVAVSTWQAMALMHKDLLLLQYSGECGKTVLENERLVTVFQGAF